MMLLLLLLFVRIAAAAAVGREAPHKLNSIRLKRIVISVGFFAALYI